jgi:hypothetical protein
MKARTTLLIFASLLLVASLAGAETPAPADLAAVFAQPAMSTVAGASCSASLAALPLPAAAPHAIALTGALCGTCSRSPCIGATTGELCVVGETRGTCQSVLGNSCSPGITLMCQCWSGPLP